jgi:hypothetical protein
MHLLAPFGSDREVKQENQRSAVVLEREKLGVFP